MCSFIFFFVGNQYLALFDSLMTKQHFSTSEQYNTGNHSVTGLSRHWINRYVHSLNANPHFADIFWFSTLNANHKFAWGLNTYICMSLKTFFTLFDSPIYSYYLILPYKSVSYYHDCTNGIYPPLCCTYGM